MSHWTHAALSLRPAVRTELMAEFLRQKEIHSLGRMYDLSDRPAHNPIVLCRACS